ncbi:MAG: hypothetical protein ACJAT7_000663 [Psychromonas sp.]|jgi:hypothetical protein
MLAFSQYRALRNNFPFVPNLHIYEEETEWKEGYDVSTSVVAIQ